VSVVVVIVIIPITVGVPAVAVLIPPAMVLAPAALSRFVQFVPRVIRLPAVPAVILDSFMQSMVRLGNPPLASVIFVGGGSWHSRKRQHAENRGSGQHRTS
jgi:hypothetical protein